MNRRILVAFLAPFRGSIRNQLLAALMGLLLFGSVLLAFVFFFQARSTALKQMRESYSSLAGMVARLSVYDIQFNRAGLSKTTQKMVEADPNLLWVEVIDDQGKTLGSEGDPKNAPKIKLGTLSNQGEVLDVKSSKGSALLVRMPIVTTAMENSSSSLDLGFEMSEKPARGTATTRKLGELRLVVDLAPVTRLKRRYLAVGSLVLLIVLIAGLFVSMFIARYFTSPIFNLRDYARKIADGNLVKMKTVGKRNDELGMLLASFQEMTDNLVGIVRENRSAFRRVEESTQMVRSHIDSTMKNTREQEVDSADVKEKVSSIQKAVDAVAKLMEGLSGLAEEVSSSVLQMIASIEEISRNTKGLNDALSTSSSTLSQNVAANKEIDASVEKLNRFVEDTSSAMTQMEESIRQIDENASNTEKATEKVAEEAKSGIIAIQQSSDSMAQLQRSFEETATTMKQLGKQSREVGNVLAVIDEVMDQTHLLALNAAIIAAQAGEHGKPFAVVASEIKELASKTSISTGEIAGIIDTVQKGVQQAVDAVGKQRDLVEETVRAYGEAAKVFNGIQEGVKPSLVMTQEIARATAEQAQGAKSIVRSTEQLRDLAHQLRHATKEQALGSEQILEAQRRISELSEEMERALSEQSSGSALIREAMDRLTSSVERVLAQNQAQRKAGKAVEETMEQFAVKGRASVESLEEAVKQVDTLSEKADEVSTILSRFRIEEG